MNLSVDTLVLAGAALLGVIVAALAAMAGWRGGAPQRELAKQQTQERKKAEAASKRADLRFERSGSELVVKNEGPGRARDIDLDGECDHGVSLFSSAKSQLPIPLLRSGERTRVRILSELGCGDVLLTYSRLDEDGVRRGGTYRLN